MIYIESKKFIKNNTGIFVCEDSDGNKYTSIDDAIEACSSKARDVKDKIQTIKLTKDTDWGYVGTEYNENNNGETGKHFEKTNFDLNGFDLKVSGEIYFTGSSSKDEDDNLCFGMFSSGGKSNVSLSSDSNNYEEDVYDDCYPFDLLIEMSSDCGKKNKNSNLYNLSFSGFKRFSISQVESIFNISNIDINGCDTVKYLDGMYCNNVNISGANSIGIINFLCTNSENPFSSFNFGGTQISNCNIFPPESGIINNIDTRALNIKNLSISSRATGGWVDTGTKLSSFTMNNCYVENASNKFSINFLESNSENHINLTNTKILNQLILNIPNLSTIYISGDENSWIGPTFISKDPTISLETTSKRDKGNVNILSGNYIGLNYYTLDEATKRNNNIAFSYNDEPDVIFYGKIPRTKELILLIKSNKTLNSTPEAGKIKYLKYNGNWTLPTPSDLKDYTLHFDKQPVQYLPGMTLRQGGEWELRAYGLYSPKVYTSGTSTVTLKFDVFGNGSFDATIYCGGKLRREVDYIIYAMNQNSTPIDFRTAMKNGTYATWSTTEDKKGFIVHATNVTTGTYYIHFGIHSKESNYNSAYCYLNSIELKSNNVSFSNGEGDFSYTFTFDNRWNVCRNTWGNSKKLPLVSVKNSEKEWEYFYKDTNGIPPN